MPHSAQATAVAGGLWGLGIRPGEPVALLVSNRPEWLTTALGCALIGAPVVSTWSRRVELEYALDHSQAVALVTLDGFLGADYQAMLREIIPEATRCPPGQIDAARLPARELIVLGQPTLAAARLDEVLARGRGVDPAVVRAASARVQPTDLLRALHLGQYRAAERRHLSPRGVPRERLSSASASISPAPIACGWRCRSVGVSPRRTP